MYKISIEYAKKRRDEILEILRYSKYEHTQISIYEIVQELNDLNEIIYRHDLYEKMKGVIKGNEAEKNSDLS